MEIKTFVSGLLSNNTYLAVDSKGKTCFLVDPSTNDKRVAKYIEDNSLALEGILLTHGHFDHIGGVKFFKDRFCCKVYMHADDVEFIDNPLEMSESYDKFAVDETVKDGNELELRSERVKVVHTPGHSKGGVCYVAGKYVFCGDTVFRASYGRTDFRGGDFLQLKQSVKKVLDMPGYFILLCGHGESTTSEFERRYNPILRYGNDQY